VDARDLVFADNSWRAIDGAFSVRWGKRHFLTRRAFEAATVESGSSGR
jgi:hypothetical protein